MSLAEHRLRGSGWDCPPRTSAVLPTLPGNSASAPLRTAPPARSLDQRTTNCVRASPRVALSLVPRPLRARHVRDRVHQTGARASRQRRAARGLERELEAILGSSGILNLRSQTASIAACSSYESLRARLCGLLIASRLRRFELSSGFGETLEPDASGLPAKRLIITLTSAAAGVKRCSRCGSPVEAVHDVTERRVRIFPS